MALSRSPVNVQLNSLANGPLHGSASSPYYTAWVDSKTKATSETNPSGMDSDAGAASNLQVFHLEGSGAETVAVRIRYTGSAPSATVLRAYGFFPHRPTDRKNGAVADSAGEWAFLYAQGTTPVAAATITGPTTAGLVDSTYGYTPDIFIDLCGCSKFIVVVSTATATSTLAALQARFMSGAGNR